MAPKFKKGGGGGDFLWGRASGQSRSFVGPLSVVLLLTVVCYLFEQGQAIRIRNKNHLFERRSRKLELDSTINGSSSSSPTSSSSSSSSPSASQAPSTNEKSAYLSTLDEADPMEPCYLANNRASESLTISEATPVGTIVGEIMVSSSSGSGKSGLCLPVAGHGPISGHLCGRSECLLSVRVRVWTRLTVTCVSLCVRLLISGHAFLCLRERDRINITSLSLSRSLICLSVHSFCPPFMSALKLNESAVATATRWQSLSLPPSRSPLG